MQKRNTPAKQMIRELLATAGSALSQDILESRLKNKVDRVTIYRILASFCEDGLLHRVVSDDGKAYYALCSNCKEENHTHDHAHFRCLHCSRVECLPYPSVPQLPDGYKLQTMNFWISGHCKACHSVGAVDASRPD